MDLVPSLPASGRFWKPGFFRSSRGDTSSTSATSGRGAGEGIVPLYDPALHQQHHGEIDEPADLRDLNTAMAALVDLFPAVHPDVFREMLRNISAESRVQVVTEQMLKHQAKGGAQPRCRALQAPPAKGSQGQSVNSSDGTLTLEDTFRSDSYRTAVRQVLYQEFRSLSHSTVKGVMAENNYSYTRSRPVLQQISSKSWRFSLLSLWSRKAAAATASAHPFVTWGPGSQSDTLTAPAIKRTGSTQLDHELHMLFVAPVIAANRQNLLTSDHAFATEINENEARESDALFGCECCYDSVPFEQLTVCDRESVHQLCHSCVSRTAKESLYGQGWARTVDLEKSTIRCFAPTATAEGCCDGAIPASLARQALRDEQGNEDLWRKFQTRVANDVLRKSRVPLHRCPFCEYAEVSETPALKLRNYSQISRHLYRQCPPAFQIFAIGMFFAAMIFLAFPFLVLMTLAILVPSMFTATNLGKFLPTPQWFTNSLSRVQTTRQPMPFKCRSPECARKSCTRCLRPWRDPHSCFDAERTSLRTALESAATAAVARTCPVCRLSFVKASGCNKLVCPCGYAMCYLCRQQIKGSEGYAHFCPHFRPSGRRGPGGCTECDRCDLYADEDERIIVRNALGKAEGEWRAKFATGTDAPGDGAQQLAVEALIQGNVERAWWEIGLDAVIDAVVA